MKQRLLLKSKAAQSNNSRRAAAKLHQMLMPARLHLLLKEYPLLIHLHRKVKIWLVVLNKPQFIAIKMKCKPLELKVRQTAEIRIKCWINFKPQEFHVDVVKFLNTNSTQVELVANKKRLHLQKHISLLINKFI